jgi:hypothetical protein
MDVILFLPGGVRANFEMTHGKTLTTDRCDSVVDNHLLLLLYEYVTRCALHINVALKT